MTATKQSGGFIFHRRNRGPISASEYRVPEGGVRRENNDYDPTMFEAGSYETGGVDVNFLNLPVYRAETKQEFGIDAIIGLAKVSGAFLTGGSSGAGIASWNYLVDVTESD